MCRPLVVKSPFLIKVFKRRCRVGWFILSFRVGGDKYLRSERPFLLQTNECHLCCEQNYDLLSLSDQTRCQTRSVSVATSLGVSVTPGFPLVRSKTTRSWCVVLAAGVGLVPAVPRRTGRSGPAVRGGWDLPVTPLPLSPPAGGLRRRPRDELG